MSHLYDIIARINMAFYCEICDKSFANKSNLNRHNTSKHKIEDDSTYTDDEMESDYDDDTYCDICEKTFANKRNLNRHKLLKHANHESEENESDESEDNESNLEEIQVNNLNKAANFVWSIIIEECQESGKSVTEVYQDKVIFNVLFNKDCTHLKVMETLNRFKKEDNMDFIEALENAVERRKFLIERQVQNIIDYKDSDV